MWYQTLTRPKLKYLLFTNQNLIMMIPVKCLNQSQMKYIMSHFKDMTAKEMADVIQVDEIKISLFCQVNDISPVPRKGNRKPIDTFHAIPHEKKLRMKREGYNGPQKKTA